MQERAGQISARCLPISGKAEKGELRGLKGLLYFTDGKGIFPERMPPYDALSADAEGI